MLKSVENWLSYLVSKSHCAFPVRINHNGINILTGNGDVTHRECTSSPEMGMCLTGNGDVPHREWGCDLPGMRILTGKAHPGDFVTNVTQINSQSD